LLSEELTELAGDAGDLESIIALCGEHYLGSENEPELDKRFQT